MFFLSHPSDTFGTGWDGTCNYLLFYIFQECDVLVIPQYIDDLVLECLPYTFPMPLFEDTLPRQHPDLEKWDSQGVEPEHSEEHAKI